MIYPGFIHPKPGESVNVFGLDCIWPFSLIPHPDTAYIHTNSRGREGWYHHSTCRMLLVLFWWRKKKKIGGELE